MIQSLKYTSKGFVFTNILEGIYHIQIRNSNLCWEKESFKIELQRDNITGIVFEQSGFAAFYQVEKDISLRNVKTGESILLEKGKEKICLQE